MAGVNILVVALVRRYLVNVRPFHVKVPLPENSQEAHDVQDIHDLVTLFSVHLVDAYAYSMEDSNIMHRYFPFFAASLISYYKVVNTFVDFSSSIITSWR